MVKTKSNLGFKLMEKLGMPIRDFFMPPDKMLAEVEIKEGFQILDFGCGPGTFSIKLAEKTGPSGQVHALDILPLALETVEKNFHKWRGNGLGKVLAGRSFRRRHILSGFFKKVFQHLARPVSQGYPQFIHIPEVPVKGGGRDTRLPGHGPQAQAGVPFPCGQFQGRFHECIGNLFPLLFLFVTK